MDAPKEAGVFKSNNFVDGRAFLNEVRVQYNIKYKLKKREKEREKGNAREKTRARETERMGP